MRYIIDHINKSIERIDKSLEAASPKHSNTISYLKGKKAAYIDILSITHPNPPLWTYIKNYFK